MWLRSCVTIHYLNDKALILTLVRVSLPPTQGGLTVSVVCTLSQIHRGATDADNGRNPNVSVPDVGDVNHSVYNRLEQPTSESIAVWTRQKSPCKQRASTQIFSSYPLWIPAFKLFGFSEPSVSTGRACQVTRRCSNPPRWLTTKC